MEYTIQKLATLSGVSTRTLRYYDKIGLLKPKRISHNQYRVYGQKEVDLLQLILFYRDLGFRLEEIKQIITAPDFDQAKAMERHLAALLQRREELEVLIQNVTKTIRVLKGETVMSDKEKFEGFKKKLIEENEQKYGSEIREKYGQKAVAESNAKVAGMSEEDWERQEELSRQIFGLLQKAMKINDPAGEDAQKACDLHRQWLCMFWADGVYSKKAHREIGEMYVADVRFKAYYDDALGKGAAVFLKDALAVYTK